MRIEITTYRDAVEHLLDFVGATTDETSERFARAAVLQGMREFCAKKDWIYFQHAGRITTDVPYSTGTVQYLHSSGDIPRKLILSSGTWPAWAGDGRIFINGTPHMAFSRISGTVLQLATFGNPGEDIAAGTTYTIVHDMFTLPADFGSMTDLVSIGWSRGLTFTTPDLMLQMQRLNTVYAIPTYYAIMGDPRRQGALAIAMHPAPDLLYNFDYIYRRQPRTLSILEESTGTASSTNAVLSLTGAGTNWKQRHVGAIVRLAYDNSSGVPTGPAGTNPSAVDRTVSAVVSTTELTLDQDPQETLTNVAFCISDPIDLEPGAMLNYFLHECRRQFRILRRIKEESGEDARYNEARIAAMEADSRRPMPRSALDMRQNYINPKYLPLGADQG